MTEVIQKPPGFMAIGASLKLFLVALALIAIAIGGTSSKNRDVFNYACLAVIILPFVILPINFLGIVLGVKQIRAKKIKKGFLIAGILLNGVIVVIAALEVFEILTHPIMGR